MRLKLRPMPEMNIVGLAKYQQSSDKLLYCEKCKYDWIDAVPDSFPLDKYPCDNCEAVGGVYQGVLRTEY